MPRFRLLPVAMLVGVLSAVLLPVLSAGAAEETTDTTVATTESTVAEGETVVTKAPAVEVVEEAPVEELAPWTIRYLIPASLVIAGALIFATVVQYFLKVVRTRYKTVE